MDVENQGNCKAVMFDLDGTLLYTLEDLADSVNCALEELGLPTHPLSHFNTAVGDGVELMVERSLPPSRRDPETMAHALELVVAEYSHRWDTKTRPYEGVPEMLNALAAAGVVKCILSNKPDPATQEVVSEFLPDWKFDVVRGAREDIPIKPDPQAALDIVRNYDTPPEKWLYVGDTDTDMQTASNAGMFALGVSWGFRTAQELKENGADAIVDHPSQIMGFIDTGNQNEK